MGGAARSAAGRACALAAVLLACAAADAPAAHPHRVVAVGDLHGDLAAWRAIAVAAGLLDPQGRWVGGETVLVQAGDVIDRGPDGRKLMLELMRLQREAPRSRGRVVALVGNHEAMNMTGDLRYVSPADLAAYADARSAALRDRVYEAARPAIEDAYRRRDPGLDAARVRAAWYAATPLGWLEHKAAWAPDGAIGRWVAGNPAAAQLDGALFVHGGIGPAYAAVPLAEINARVARALTAREASADPILTDPEGPLWYRGWAQAPAEPDDAAPSASSSASASATAALPPPGEAELGRVLAAHAAQRMVIAHTPNLAGIVTRFDGRLIRIDTGISRVYGGALSWLELVDGRPTPHTVPRPPAAGAP